MPYRYAGQHPVPDGKGGIVRPGEIWDEPAEDFGPWDEIPADDEDDEPETPAAARPAPPPPPPSPAPAGPSSTVTPPAAGNGGK